MKFNKFDSEMNNGLKHNKLRLMTDDEVEVSYRSNGNAEAFFNHCAKIVPFTPLIQAKKWFDALVLDHNDLRSIRKGTYITDTEARNIASFFKYI